MKRILIAAVVFLLSASLAQAAVRSFTNPDADRFAKEFGLGVGYNAEADRRSWADMQEFFKKLF